MKGVILHKSGWLCLWPVGGTDFSDELPGHGHSARVQ